MIDDIRGASKLPHAEDMATTTTRLRQCPRLPRTPRAALDALMGVIGDRLHREGDLAARAGRPDGHEAALRRSRIPQSRHGRAAGRQTLMRFFLVGRRRPNPLLVAYRWRYEMGLAASAVTGWAELPSSTALTAAGLLAATTAAVAIEPRCRRVLIHASRTRHRATSCADRLPASRARQPRRSAASHHVHAHPWGRRHPLALAAGRPRPGGPRGRVTSARRSMRCARRPGRHGTWPGLGAACRDATAVGNAGPVTRSPSGVGARGRRSTCPATWPRPPDDKRR